MSNCIRIDIFKLLFKLQGKNMNFKSTFILLQLSLTLLSAEVSPAVPPWGWTLNASVEALAERMLNPGVTALVSPVLERVRV